MSSIALRSKIGSPCEVCLSESKGCSTTTDGLHFCRGEAKPGWNNLGKDELGFGHYRRSDPDHRSKRTTPAPHFSANWAQRVATYVSNIEAKPEELDYLSQKTGLPKTVFSSFELGVNTSRKNGKEFTIPERNGKGEIIGISTRYESENKPVEKKCITGSNRGLIVPENWRETNGPIFLVEGFTDTAALTAAGLCAIGRPSNHGGIDALSQLLSDGASCREIVVVGENDKKADGKWPGLEGAKKTAQELAIRLRCEVKYSLPPTEAKDVRAWLIDECQQEKDWQTRGSILAQLLISNSKSCEAVHGSESKSHSSTAMVNTRRVADIEAKPVSWLWAGRIPFGMLTILDGDPGQGKSGITIDIASRLSNGWGMPYDEANLATGDSMFLCGEDSPEHTIRPRLHAAQADLTKVHILDDIDIGSGPRPIVLPGDLGFIEAKIVELGVKLFVVDPIMGFLSHRTDANSDSSSREVLQALKSMAERTGTAVLILRHMNKKNGESAMYRGGGSIAFTAAARSAMLVGNHPTENDKRILAPVKLNIARKPNSIIYELENKDGFPVVRWGDECDLTADDIATRQTSNPKEALAEAEEFLQSELAKGPVKTKELQAKARDNGISIASLRRAKDALRVASRKGGFTGKLGWEWYLPGAETAERAAEGANDIPL